MLDLSVCVGCRYGCVVMGSNGAPEPELINCGVCGHPLSSTDEIPTCCEESLSQAVSVGLYLSENT